MRALAFVLCVCVLAGCTTVEDDDRLTCPQWSIPSGSTATFVYGPHFFHNLTYTESPYDSDNLTAREQRNGGLLDRFDVEFKYVEVQDQRLTITAYRMDDGRQLAWRPVTVGGNPIDAIVFGSGVYRNLTYTLDLSDGGPTDVRVEYVADQDLDGDPRTDSYTAMRFTSTALYLVPDCQ